MVPPAPHACWPTSCELTMIDEARGPIDYATCGAGPTMVLVPGSCSTGAAWRPVISALNGQFTCVTTSLLGYGGTAERRTARDPDIAHEAEVLESVIGEAGPRVHLVGHSFGGLVALAVALRKRVSLASLAVLEAPAAELLQERGEHRLYRAFRRMTEAYFTDVRSGNAEAIVAMIDFYGGAGTSRPGRRGFAPMPWRPRRSTFWIGPVRTVFPYRWMRCRPLTFRFVSFAAGPVTLQCNGPIRSSPRA
jgi:pimeloyl-ACP methyl ester carboxylesterase